MRRFSVASLQKSLSNEAAPRAHIRLEYPVFEPLDTSSQEKKLADTLNRFYRDTSARALAHAQKHIHRASPQSAPFDYTCRYVVSFAGDDYISVYADGRVTDESGTRVFRRPHLWSTEKGTLLPPGQVLHTDKQARKKLFHCILMEAEKNIRRKTFTYFDNYPSLLQKHFDFSSFYFLPGGGAFCFKCGSLGASGEQIPVFVLPPGELSALLRVVPREWSGGCIIRRQQNKH